MTIWWKLGLGAVVAAALFLLVTMYGKAQYQRGRADENTAWTKVAIAGEQDKLKEFKSGVAAVMGADTRYIETVREKIIPVTKTIVEKTDAYRQTADGLSICLEPDRVREAEDLTAVLFPASEAGDTRSTVPANSLDR